MIEASVAFLASNWDAALGVLGTLIGIWLSWKLRGHPLLGYTVFEPRSAAPGIRIKVRAGAGADGRMRFQARISNTGTDRIEQPASSGGDLGLDCEKGRRVAGASVDAHNSNLSQKLSTGLIVSENGRRLTIDFSALEPRQWMEFSYDLERTECAGVFDNPVRTPIASGYLPGSLTAVRNRRSPIAAGRDLVFLLLIQTATVLQMFAVALVGAWLVRLFLPSAAEGSLCAVLTAGCSVVLFLVLQLLSGIPGRFVAYPGLEPPEKTATRSTVVGGAIATIALLALWLAINGTVAAASSAQLFQFAAVAALVPPLYYFATYNPTADAAAGAGVRLLQGGALYIVLLGVLVVAMVTGVLGTSLASGIYLPVFALTQVLVVARARQQGQR
ncbi:hypothetical protein [Leucobacter sp. 1207-22]|uniref:hypothetical protein n=1 Tax=Leucobacter sp. 1207-22 TaxID=2604456 RepID=UPI004063548C